MGCSIDSHQRRWMQYPRRRPIASLLAGLSPAGMAASLAARSIATGWNQHPIQPFPLHPESGRKVRAWASVAKGQQRTCAAKKSKSKCLISALSAMALSRRWRSRPQHHERTHAPQKKCGELHLHHVRRFALKETGSLFTDPQRQTSRWSWRTVKCVTDLGVEA